MSKSISVIMPVKNGEKYLKEAICGIQNQNMDTEIIVINDGSTDRTEQIAKDTGCFVISHECSKGPVAAKNTGLKEAHGEYVMFHDSDDVMNENALQKLYDALETDESACAVMAKVKDFISPDVENPARESLKSEPYYGLFTGAVLMQRSVFNIIGLFNENIPSGEIIEWANKMAEHNLKIKKIDMIAANRRIHDCNYGKTHRAIEFKNYAQILRARLKKAN